MAKNNGIYLIPSGIDQSVSNVIQKQLADSSLVEGKLQDDILDKQIRNVSVSWINTDHWISGMLAHFISVANKDHFHYDLHGWADRIQYSVYDGKGTGYRWHNDHQKSVYYTDMVRKLSISLCLSDDYEGGEFQIYDHDIELSTFKMKSGDVVIFSSEMMHRVRPIKSGCRSSLVGWYAGPNYK
tara:strand:- start:11312 stop:11863 length:552 start_codon:yes stop_codon:yes gene_type:complete